MKTKVLYISAIALSLNLGLFAQNAAEGVYNGTNNRNNESIVVAQENLPSNNRLAGAAELINYQAVARDGSGNLIVNSAITVDFEIRDGSGGSAVFNETQNLNTDENGVFSAQVGSVNPLDNVNWLDIDAWLQVDVNGSNVGETQVGSSVTALHSKQSAQVLLFGSGSTNADKMIVQHSPGYPGWGIGYADVGDYVNFMAAGTTNLSIDLATGNMTGSGYIELTTTTDSPAENRIYGNTSPIAYGSIDSLGGISTGYGITSVNNSATGVYEITIDLDSNITNTVVMITPFTIGFGIPEIAGYETINANNFIVRIQDASGTARDSAFTFVVYPQ